MSNNPTPTVRCYACMKKFRGYGWYCPRCAKEQAKKRGKKNPPGGQFYLNRRRSRSRHRWRDVRGIIAMPSGSRQDKIHVGIRNPRPSRRNPGGGRGTNWLLIGGLAAGAFFLLPKLAGAGGITSLFGGGTAAVPPGYTPIGNGLYRAPNGQIVARNPQTGQMVAAPAGSVPTSAEDLLTRAGISLIPSVANTLASWVSSMFSTQQTATGAIPGTWGSVSGPYEESGAALPANGSIFGGGEGYLAPLAPLPESSYSFWGGTQVEESSLFGGGEGLPPITALPTYPVYDWGTDWGSYEYGGYDLPGIAPLDYDVMIGVGSGDVVIANPDEWYGFFGLGDRGGHRRPYMGLRATPPVY